MLCPICNSEVSDVNGTHYICTNENCLNLNGKRTEFKIIYENKLLFPFNVIFPKRSPNEFYRVQYIDSNHL